MDQFLAMLLADANCSPQFQSAMALQAPDQTALPIRCAHYVAALVRFDFQFEHSDDHAAWRRGRDEFQRLRAERKIVDPDGALWAKHMHESFRHG